MARAIRPLPSSKECKVTNHRLDFKFAREHGRVTIGETIKLTGVSRNTLKQHFRTLVQRGTLNQHGSGRGVWYDLR